MESLSEQRINNILDNLYSNSSLEQSSDSQISAISLDERYFSIEENDSLSKIDQKKIRKCKISESKSSCSVCLEKYKKNQIIMILPCNHKFHYKCMKPWFKNSVFCPLCRLDIKKHFNPDSESVASDITLSSGNRNSLLDRSFIQPRQYTPLRSLNQTRRR